MAKELQFVDSDCKCPKGPCYHDEIFKNKTVPDNIFDYFTKRLGIKPTGVIYNREYLEGVKSLRELPVKSACGKDCKRVIVKAQDLMLVSDPAAHDSIRTAALTAVMIYWVG